MRCARAADKTDRSQGVPSRSFLPSKTTHTAHNRSARPPNRSRKTSFYYSKQSKPTAENMSAATANANMNEPAAVKTATPVTVAVNPSAGATAPATSGKPAQQTEQKWKSVSSLILGLC